MLGARGNITCVAAGGALWWERVSVHLLFSLMHLVVVWVTSSSLALKYWDSE